MTYMDGPPSHRKYHRPLRRRVKQGKEPRNDEIRQLILKAAEEYKNFTPAELKAVLQHDHQRDVTVDEVIGAISGL